MKKTLLLFVSLLMTMGMFAQSKTAKFDFTGESAYGMTLLSGSTKNTTLTLRYVQRVMSLLLSMVRPVGGKQPTATSCVSIKAQI